MSTAIPPGISVVAVTRFLLSTVPTAAGPIEFSLLAGGKSNITYLATFADGTRVVLRRPPLGHILPTAHDMAREYRLLSRLSGTTVPVPRPLALCDDPGVNGQTFYVMEYVPGIVIDTERPPGPLDRHEARGRLSESLIDTLAALHTLDVEAAGLADFGRPAGFMARQVNRWTQQWYASETDVVPEMASLSERLLAAVPEPNAAAVLHGDYRLGNLILDGDSHAAVAAVVDWEMSTLGDPLSDLAYLLCSWGEPGDAASRSEASQVNAVTAAPGFLTRQELVNRYASKTGFDVSQLGFYVAFSYFKIAGIQEGLYARYLKGETVGEGFEDFGRSARAAIRLALETADASSIP